MRRALVWALVVVCTGFIGCSESASPPAASTPPVPPVPQLPGAAAPAPASTSASTTPVAAASANSAPQASLQDVPLEELILRIGDTLKEAAGLMAQVNDDASGARVKDQMMGVGVKYRAMTEELKRRPKLAGADYVALLQKVHANPRFGDSLKALEKETFRLHKLSMSSPPGDGAQVAILGGSLTTVTIDIDRLREREASKFK